MVQDTQIDVLVLGATGYTGRLVARYLSTHSEFLDNKFTFALGGRSKDKLGQIASELGISEERVPHVIVDVLDAGQVARAVQGVRVVANVVGPYWRWGKLVVKYVHLVLGFLPITHVAVERAQRTAYTTLILPVNRTL